jgi:hypothetical protein
MATLTLPRKPQEAPEKLRFVERKGRINQRPRLVLQELIEEPSGPRWRDVPIARDP